MKDIEVKIAITPTNEGINVSWEYSVLYIKEESGVYSCYIPGFEIYFNAKDSESIDKAQALTSIFFNSFFLEPKDGLKKLAAQLHRKEFYITNKSITMQHLLNNNLPRATRFKPNKGRPIPKEFATAEEFSHKGELVY